jgi:hypothetical protein
VYINIHVLDWAFGSPQEHLIFPPANSLHCSSDLRKQHCSLTMHRCQEVCADAELALADASTGRSELSMTIEGLLTLCMLIRYH